MVKSLIRFIEEGGDMNALSAREQGNLWTLYEVLRNAFGLKFQSVSLSRPRPEVRQSRKRTNFWMELFCEGGMQ